MLPTITQKQKSVIVMVEPKKETRSTLKPMMDKYINPKNNPRFKFPLSFPTAGIWAAAMEIVEISRILPALAMEEGRSADSLVAMVTMVTAMARSHAISWILHFCSAISTGSSPSPMRSLSERW